MKCAALLAAVVLWWSTAPAWAQTEPTPPDEIACRILFQLMRSGRDGAWNAKAQALWLEKHKVPLQFFFTLQKAADAYWGAVAPLEEDLKNIHLRFAGRNNSPEAAAAARPVLDRN